MYKLKRQTVKNQIVPKDYDLEKIGITQSLINSFLSCPRKFLLKTNRWRSDISNKNTSFGNIVHYCLDKIYKLSFQRIKYKINKTVLLAKYLSELIENYEAENQDNLTGIDENELNWEKKVAQIILLEYIKYYPEDFSKKRFTDVEKEISVTFGDFTLNCKIDGKYQTKNKLNWLMEHKTKSRIVEDSMMKALTFDFQCLFYLTCAEAYYEENIEGVLYNIIRKPQIKQKRGETEIEYFKRLKTDIRDRRKFYFMRYEIPFFIPDKETFKNELETILELIDLFISENHFSSSSRVFWRNSNNCIFPYRCNFLDACSSGEMTGYFKTDKLFTELKTINY